MSQELTAAKPSRLVLSGLSIYSTTQKIKERLAMGVALLALGSAMPAAELLPWVLVLAGAVLVLLVIFDVALGLDEAGISAAWPRVSTLILTFAPIAVVSATASGL